MTEQEMRDEYIYYIRYIINTTRDQKYLVLVSYDEFKRTYPLHSCPHYMIIQF